MPADLQHMNSAVGTRGRAAYSIPPPCGEVAARRGAEPGGAQSNVIPAALITVAPFLRVAADQRAEALRAALAGARLLLAQGFEIGRILLRRARARRQPCHDRRRRAGRQHQAEPALGDDARQAGLAHGRHVGQRDGARRRCDGKRIERAALDLRRHHRGVADDRVDLPADHVGQRRAGRAERHVGDVDAGLAPEQLDGQVRDRADPGRADRDLAGIGLGVGDEFGQRLRRQLRVGHQHLGGEPDAAERDEVLLDVVGDLLARGMTVNGPIAPSRMV